LIFNETLSTAVKPPNFLLTDTNSRRFIIYF
jgi:hypothetical protein